MSDIAYLNLIEKTFEKLEKLELQRENIELEISKSEQFIFASANMLPDEGRNAVIEKLQLIQALRTVREAGLTDAVKNILRKSPNDWHTATNVRDKLMASGFDFNNYTSNPLASVHTVLKRLKSEDVDFTNVDGGVMAWRWKQKNALSAHLHAATSMEWLNALPPTEEPPNVKPPVRLVPPPGWSKEKK